MAAAIVEFDSLPDAVGAASQDHDPSAALRLAGRFVLVFVGRIEIWGVGGELGGTRIDLLEGSLDAQPLAGGPHVHFGRAPPPGQLAIGETASLGFADQFGGCVLKAVDGADLVLDRHEVSN